MSFYYKFVKTVATPIAHLLVRYHCIGEENLPESGGFILCPNHTSMIDIGLLVLTSRRPIYFMAKEELFHNPVLAWFFRHMGGFPISRGKGDTEALDKAKNIVKRGDILGIFPEGTRTKDPTGHPARGKSGAAMIASQTGADVVPCAIHYDGYDGKIHLFKKSYVHFGKPIKAEELKINGLDRAELKNATSKIMTSITSMWEEDTGCRLN